MQEQKRKDDVVLVNEMMYNEALIDERDHGIAEIQQQIGEVNEIFQVSPLSPFPASCDLLSPILTRSLKGDTATL